MRQDDGQAALGRDLELSELQEDGRGRGVDCFVSFSLFFFYGGMRVVGSKGRGYGMGTQADATAFLFVVQDSGGGGYEEYDKAVEGDCGGLSRE